MKRVNTARLHEEFLHKLFGDVIPVGDAYQADREAYTRAMHEIQEKYGLKQGHPDFPAWLMTLLIHSPAIIGDSEERDDDEANEGE